MAHISVSALFWSPFHGCNHAFHLRKYARDISIREKIDIIAPCQECVVKNQAVSYSRWMVANNQYRAMRRNILNSTNPNILGKLLPNVRENPFGRKIYQRVGELNCVSVTQQSVQACPQHQLGHPVFVVPWCPLRNELIDDCPDIAFHIGVIQRVCDDHVTTRRNDSGSWGPRKAPQATT